MPTSNLALSLFAFLWQTDLVIPNCTVPHCNEDSCSGSICLECEYGYFLNNGCSECGLKCQDYCGLSCYSCINNSCPNEICRYNNCPISGCSSFHGVICSSCPDGFYLNTPGKRRCYRCTHTNCKCSMMNDCTECLPGKYGTSNFCNGDCPSNCKICLNESDCTECKAGKYGRSCENECTNRCDDGSCDKQLGTCLKSCAANEYFDSSKCKTCPDRCSSCLNSTYCIKCDKYYNWGKTCEYDCTGCYNLCNRSNGCPSGCEGPYYQTYNDIKHGFECIGCPSNCTVCENESLCSSCVDGYWGSICQYSCTGCIDKCDKNQGCNECLSYYFQRFTDSGKECLKCPEKCKVCSNATHCDECENKYYLHDKYYCSPCSSNCKNDNCSTRTGSCIDGCVGGRTGNNCDSPCPSNCLQCSQFNISLCFLCDITFYGTACQYECNKCSRLGTNQICNKNDGSCLYGCELGYWGPTCDMSCEGGCAENSCSVTTGECLHGCKAMYYGTNCKFKCSEECTFSQGQRQCDIVNGSCLAICSDELTGADCYETTDHDTSSQSRSNITIPAGVGGGSAVVIIAAVVALLVLWKRRRRSDKQESEERTSVEQSNSIFAKEDNVYTTIVDTSPKGLELSIGTENSSAVINIIPDPGKTNEKCEIAEPNHSTKGNHRESISVRQNRKGSFDKAKARQDQLKLITEQKADKITDKDIYLTELSPRAMAGKQIGGSSMVKTHVSRLKGQVNLNDIANNKESETFKTYEDGDAKRNTYYNTIGKRVLVQDLRDYVSNKSYEDIVDEFKNLPCGLLKTYDAAKNPKNAAKNRYREIYPYDELRVVLSDGGDDYINASYIEGFNQNKEYIASAGPFKRKENFETTADFWRIIWQEKCQTIVMLTKCYEDSQHKCEQYWPDRGGTKIYGTLHVTCVTEDQYAEFTIRLLIVTKDEDTLNIHHIQFIGWPDKGVPDNVTSMIEYRQKVRSLHKDKECPVLVHCSAGIGRTGTFISIDMLTFIGESRGYVDIFGCVKDLRQQRVNMVQTAEQYEYIHHAVLHALTLDCKSIPSDSFISHYSRLTKKKAGSCLIETQFKKLKSITSEMTEDEAEEVFNNKNFKDKNRDCANIPSDENRVRLFENRKPSDSDYINAVFINGYRASNRFIVAQTPLPTTVVDFFTMVYQTKCSCIVMMEEPDLQDKTVGLFWPADNQIITYDVFHVRCTESKTNENFTLKKLTVRHRNTTKEDVSDINLFICSIWPKGTLVPKSSESLLQLIKDVDTTNLQAGVEKERPIIVLCMTGAERSCVYCAVSNLIEKIQIEHEVSVVNTLSQIMARRRSAITTLEQYKFCHQAVISYLQSFDIYSNFQLKSNKTTRPPVNDYVYATVQK